MIKKWLPKNKIILLIYILGTFVVLYPLVSNLYSKTLQHKAVRNYEKSIVTRDLERNQKKIEKMKQHNKALMGHQVIMTGADFSIGAELGNRNKKLGEVIGIIDIPKIDVELPIYYGTNERQISEGAGIMDETSLPVGGENSHSVITSHRGLPSAKLFTDLPKLVEGDSFFIHNFGEVLAYEVDQIKVIKPEDFSDLEIIKGKDMVTLLTCTPYLVNTHRLLVRGQRVAYTKDLKIEATNAGFWERMKTIFLSFTLIALLVLIIYFFNRWIRKNKKAKIEKINKTKKRPLRKVTATTKRKKTKTKSKTPRRKIETKKGS